MTNLGSGLQKRKELKMARVVWFEFFTKEAAKDLAFYKEAFGWESEQ